MAKEILALNIDTLRKAPKADVIKAAQVVQEALYSVPYMEIGKDYALHVEDNARNDFAISFQDAITGGHKTQVDMLEAKIRELEKTIQERNQEITKSRTKTLILESSARDDKQMISDLMCERDDVKRQLEAERKERVALQEMLRALKTLINQVK